MVVHSGIRNELSTRIEVEFGEPMIMNFVLPTYPNHQL
jgi:hypothetical protein